MNITEQAIEILRATNDGEDLAPQHLWLIQRAINDGLAEPALAKLFGELHTNATKPSGYTMPWLHGIEHLTMDLFGYVKWRGSVVDHFSFSGPDAWQREKAAAEALAARCRKAEGVRT